MTVVTSPLPSSRLQHVVLRDVSWALYQHLLEEVGNGPIRMTFDGGSLEIMSPLPRHELWKKRIARMIEIFALELNISMTPLGSTTFAREDLQKGLEPDECYYIEHAAAVHGKDILDLTVDPPPDLVVEVNITSRSIKREPIYAALGVPELWRFKDRGIEVLELHTDGRYKPVSRSRSFSFLPMKSFEAFLLRLEREDQTAVLREFRDWVKTLEKEP